MAMQRRYFKLNEMDSVKYHKEYLAEIGNPRRKAIREFLNACNAVGYLSHKHFGTRMPALMPCYRRWGWILV